MARRTRQHATLLLAGGLLSMLGAPGATAEEPAWIGGEARYNLRRAPGAEYRAVDLVKTGDEVVVLEETADWARVRTASGSEGWINSEHLEREAPPLARIAKLEADLVEVQKRLAEERKASEALRTEKIDLEAAAAEEREKTGQLRGENELLRAEGRWREWLTGGAIVLAGMALGALLHRALARRASARLRF